jgi:hypothetical protein
MPALNMMSKYGLHKTGSPQNQPKNGFSGLSGVSLNG